MPWSGVLPFVTPEYAGLQHNCGVPLATWKGDFPTTWRTYGEGGARCISGQRPMAREQHLGRLP